MTDALDPYRDRRFILLPPSDGIDANWHVTDDGDMCVAHCFGFCHDIAQGQQLARRIVATLNACKGRSIQELELVDPTTSTHQKRKR